MSELLKSVERLPPELVYHYSSFEALRSILTNREIWATSAWYLNDRSETVHSLELLLRLAREARSSRNLPESIDGILNTLATNNAYFGNISPCVASFSENGDLLSQWRAYCPSGLGVSIGFRTSALRHIISNHGDTTTESFVPCLYDEGRKVDLLRRIVLPHLLAILDNPTYKYEELMELANSSVSAIFFEIIQGGPMFKHSAFSEECEWRFVRPMIIGEKYLSNWKFRSGKNSLIPYVTVSFPPEVDCGPTVAEIIIGPNPEVQMAKASVEHFLQGVAPSCKVRLSSIPYRLP